MTPKQSLIACSIILIVGVFGLRWIYGSSSREGHSAPISIEDRIGAIKSPYIQSNILLDGGSVEFAVNGANGGFTVRRSAPHGTGIRLIHIIELDGEPQEILLEKDSTVTQAVIRVFRAASLSGRVDSLFPSLSSEVKVMLGGAW